MDERKNYEPTEERRLRNILRCHINPLVRQINYPLCTEDRESETGLILLNLQDDDQRAIYDVAMAMYRSERG